MILKEISVKVCYSCILLQLYLFFCNHRRKPYCWWPTSQPSSILFPSRHFHPYSWWHRFLWRFTYFRWVDPYSCPSCSTASKFVLFQSWHLCWYWVIVALFTFYMLYKNHFNTNKLTVIETIIINSELSGKVNSYGNYHSYVKSVFHIYLRQDNNYSPVQLFSSRWDIWKYCCNCLWMGKGFRQ